MFAVPQISPIFASNSLKLSFKLFFMTNVSNYCEERKIEVLINVYIKMSRNLGSNFFVIFKHSSEKLSNILQVPSGQA